jgi:hypothetical protein
MIKTFLSIIIRMFLSNKYSPFLIIIFIILFFYYFQIEHFNNSYDQVDMSIPIGQITSAIPISKKCLLDNYYKSKCRSSPHFLNTNNKNNVYDFKPFEQELKNEKESTFFTRCDSLKIKDCLATPSCGWLTNRNGVQGLCLQGTPSGPNNPKYIPDAEDSSKKNITLNSWKFSNPNPWTILNNN